MSLFFLHAPVFIVGLHAVGTSAQKVVMIKIVLLCDTDLKCLYD